MTHLPDTYRLARMVAALSIGLAGGLVFNALNLPLPWMLGSLLTVFAAVLARLPLVGPDRLRTFVIPVIGVMLGAGFTPDTLEHAGRWIVSLAFLSVYLALAAALVVPFYIRVGKLDPITAFFSAMPGGINDMVLIGREMGGDDRRIILAHAARIVVTISLVAFWFRVVLGLDVSGTASLGAKASMGAVDAVVLLGCAVAGAIAARRLRLPAPDLLGPMALSMVAHVSGLTQSSPPVLLVIAAQVSLGTMMGCRFIGAERALVIKTFTVSVGGTAIMVALSILFATVLHGVFGQTTEQVLLAYAPGGLTEMALVALAMKAEVAYISIHHLVRIMILVALGPGLLRRLAHRLER